MHPYHTHYLRRLLRSTWGDGPAPAGATVQLFEGLATGHGPRLAGTPVPATDPIDVSGVTPGMVEYHEIGHLHHELRLGQRTVAVYWHGVAGGFAVAAP